MKTTPSHHRDAVSTILERLVCDEFELMESCQEAAAEGLDEDRGRLLHHAGLCQVHLFDLESTLQELSGRRASYSTCVRRSLRNLGRRSWRDSLEKLTRRYERALAIATEPPLPDAVLELLVANTREHQTLTRIAAATASDELQRSA